MRDFYAFRTFGDARVKRGRVRRWGWETRIAYVTVFDSIIQFFQLNDRGSDLRPHGCKRGSIIGLRVVLDSAPCAGMY